jgi:hypothetical protein
MSETRMLRIADFIAFYVYFSDTALNKARERLDEEGKAPNTVY